MSSPLTQLSEAARSVAAGAASGVVRVEGGWRPASGIVVADGLVLTNAHNIHDETADITFSDGRTAVATIAGVDTDGDLAVLKVDTAGATPIAFAPDGGAAQGDIVLALAAGGQGARLTLGVVSGVARSFRGPRGRRISGSIEHTAPMAPGSSGSALLDTEGRLIGLNTNRIGGGFYLAVPTDGALRGRIDALARGESAERPRLGVGLAPSGVARRMRGAVGLPERDGALVRDVEDGSPAANAGIASGDLIVTAGGRAVGDPDDLSDALAAATGQASIELVVVRGVEERTITVTFDGD
ncbi:MAG: trypsin-like peptidase domain-containing protein [Chloroflexota bacterium]